MYTLYTVATPPLAAKRANTSLKILQTTDKSQFKEKNGLNKDKTQRSNHFVLTITNPNQTMTHYIIIKHLFLYVIVSL